MADDDLDAVYRAQGPEAAAELYDRWAGDYEADMARLGYRHPAVAVALLSRYLPRDAAPVLDVGAGTGLVGELLALLGYPSVEALDLSEEMLRVAGAKGVYERLHRASLADPLPFATDHFAAAVCVGVFTTGHVSADRLVEVLRVVRPGGVVVVTLKDGMVVPGVGTTAGGSGSRLAEELERTPSYLSMPGHASATLSHARAFRVA